MTKIIFILILGLGLIPIQPAHGGVMELSGNFSFSASDLGNGNYQWTRRWGASVGYYFWGLSEIEFSIQDVLYRTKINIFEDTTFHDQIYSIDWVQLLAPKHSLLQPYFKVGVGQLNREATGTYLDGASPPAIYDSLTAVMGAGLKILIFHSFSLRMEGTSYLTGGVLSTWQNNFGINFGCSVYL